MIRMGKSSKVKDAEALSDQITRAESPVNLYADESHSHDAISDSEMTARDIKEGRLSGFVGAGTVLTGETTFTAMLRIDGHLKGRITSADGILIIGSTGTVDADITVAQVQVNGIVNGDISASEKITLGRTARVAGNIRAPRLLVEDGAIFEGSSAMVESNQALEDAATTAPAHAIDDYAPLNVESQSDVTDSIQDDDSDYEDDVNAASA